MEKDKYPLIVEFNGLPGSGKTTTSNCLTKKLEEAGINVENLSDLIKKYKIGKAKAIIKLLKDGKILLLLYLFCFFISFKSFRLRRLKHVKNICLYYVAYAEACNKSKKTVLVIDQGIIQAIVSVAHLDHLREKNKLKKIFYTLGEKFNYLCVSCISNEEISSQRVIKREINQGRFDRMEKKDLINNLRIQNRTFTNVRKWLAESRTISQIEIDMKNQVKQNCETLYETIFKML